MNNNNNLDPKLIISLMKTFLNENLKLKKQINN